MFLSVESLTGNLSIDCEDILTRGHFKNIFAFQADIFLKQKQEHFKRLKIESILKNLIVYFRILFLF